MKNGCQDTFVMRFIIHTAGNRKETGKAIRRGRWNKKREDKENS